MALKLSPDAKILVTRVLPFYAELHDSAIDLKGRILCCVATTQKEEGKRATVLDVYDLKSLFESDEEEVTKATKRLSLPDNMRSVFNAHVPMRVSVNPDAGICVTCVRDRGTKWQFTQGIFFQI